MNDFPRFFHLYKRVKKEGLNKHDITELLENQQKLSYLEKRVEFYNGHIREQQLQIIQLKGEIDILESKRNNYDSLTPL